MCEKLRRCLALGLIALIPALPVQASQTADETGSGYTSDADLIENLQQEEETVSPLEEGSELLLIYPELPTDEQQETIEQLENAATALGRRMEYASASTAAGYIDQYQAVICYALTGEEEEVFGELRRYDGQLLFLGADGMAAYLTATGRQAAIGTGYGTSNAQLTYTFRDTEEAVKLVEIEQVCDFSILEYQSGTLETDYGEYPFFAEVGLTDSEQTARYCPLTEFSGSVLEAALIQELNTWLWPYNDMPTDYAQYLVLDEVYPFMPTDELMEKVQVCIDEDIPFVISVMPIYTNTDYPAMQQFCEVLRYAQSNGGAVILHAPILRSEVSDWDAFYESVTTATTAYTDQGVYPLGIEVPESWIWKEDYLSFMKRYRTAFVYNDTDASGFTLDAQTNLLYQNYHQLIMPAITLDDRGTSWLTCYSSAVYLDVSEDTEKLQECIDALHDSAVPLLSLWDMAHSVWANNFHMEYSSYQLTINDEVRSLRYEAEAYPEDYDYQRNTLARFTVSLAQQNKVLMVVCVAAVAIFLGLMLWATKVRRNEFRRKTEKKRRPGSRRRPQKDTEEQG